MTLRIVKSCLDSFVGKDPSVSWVLKARIGILGEGYRVNLDYQKEVGKYLTS